MLVVQAAKILREAGDNLFERLKGQSASRQILKHSVAVMASRLSIRFPCASLRHDNNTLNDWIQQRTQGGTWKADAEE